MIGYTLKNVLELIPEALPMVKSASIEEEYPISTKTNCLASALVIGYKKNFTSDIVDYDVLEKVAEAVVVYGLQESVSSLTNKMISRSTSRMVKQASESETLSLEGEIEMLVGSLSGIVNIKDVSQRSSVLFEKAASVSMPVPDQIIKYSGNGYLDKESTLASLGARFERTKDATFIKIASAMGSEPSIITSGKTVRALCSAITSLDEKHGLFAEGFDFYKEAALTKQAGFSRCNVNVAGNQYPLERILNTPSAYIDDYLGAGFSKELNSDPNSAKAMVESLPADSQRVLATILNA